MNFQKCAPQTSTDSFKGIKALFLVTLLALCSACSGLIQLTKPETYKTRRRPQTPRAFELVSVKSTENDELVELVAVLKYVGENPFPTEKMTSEITVRHENGELVTVALNFAAPATLKKDDLIELKEVNANTLPKVWKGRECSLFVEKELPKDQLGAENYHHGWAARLD